MQERKNSLDLKKGVYSHPSRHTESSEGKIKILSEIRSEFGISKSTKVLSMIIFIMTFPFTYKCIKRSAKSKKEFKAI